MNRRMNACVHGWVSICLHGWMDRSMHACMHGYACGIVLDPACVCFNMLLFCVPSFSEKFSPKSIRFIKARWASAVGRVRGGRTQRTKARVSEPDGVKRATQGKGNITGGDLEKGVRMNSGVLDWNGQYQGTQSFR